MKLKIWATIEVYDEEKDTHDNLEAGAGTNWETKIGEFPTLEGACEYLEKLSEDHASAGDITNEVYFLYEEQFGKEP